MVYFIAALIVIAIYAFSWAVTVGLLYLISLCFSVSFSFPVATGIWMIICLIQSILSAIFKDK